MDTDHETAELSIFEDGVPPRFRLTGLPLDWIRAVTVRADGARQNFAFANRGRFWESVDEIPEPHGFQVELGLGHGAHDHRYRVEFVEHAHGPPRHDHGQRHDDEAAEDPLYEPLAGGTAVLTRHVHAHRHDAIVHVHWHDHAADTAHALAPDLGRAPPEHAHRHRTSARMALLLIFGSSPMVRASRPFSRPAVTAPPLSP